MNMRWRFLDRWHDAGLLILRVGVGAAFVGIHGYPLLSEGRVGWLRVGAAVKSFGLNDGYVWWGIAAMISMLLGGGCLILGLCQRPASLTLFSTMFVAAYWRFQTSSLDAAAYPAVMAVVCLSLFILGPGKNALDKV
ncbi:hypothetical protein IMCC26134_04060 [Verrucomicrobia bacterium IMCC26134]|jgi:putative oxidoreductase|nr:hypothetical protein IMCC26134_04060 [Verrucomicrobia bacterium IMCC26134]